MTKKELAQINKTLATLGYKATHGMVNGGDVEALLVKAKVKDVKTRPGRTVTCHEAEQIANDTYSTAYSSARYGITEWWAAARFLAAHGFTAKQIEAILLSKWMRWAANAANSSDGKASHLRAYIKAMHGDEFREAAKMVKEGK